MDLNQLKTFYILAQTKNYSNCAKRLFVTQSAISHSIKKLETSVGHKLIERKGPEFHLTEQGKTLFLSCQKVFSELEETEKRFNENEKSLETIKLGSPIEFGVSILIKNITEFLESNPQFHIDFKLGNYLFPELVDDELDVLIECKEYHHEDVKTIPLFREEYAVIASPDYIEVHNLQQISDLGRCNIISLDKEQTWWDNFIHALPLELKLQFSRVTQINHVRGIINAVLHGMGVGFVPRYTILKELEEGSIIALFPEVHLLEDRFQIYIKRNKSDFQKYAELIQFIKQLKLT